MKYLILIVLLLCTTTVQSKPMAQKYNPCVPLILVKVIKNMHSADNFSLTVIQPNIIRQTCVQNWLAKTDTAVHNSIEYKVKCFINSRTSAFIYVETNNPGNIWVMYAGDRTRPQCKGIKDILL
jgi:ABC-type microcin C transport system permease subunit YejE